MIKLLVLLALALLIYLGIGHFLRLPKHKKKPAIIKFAVYSIVAILIVAALTGRIHWLGAALAGLIGVIKFSAGTLLRFLPFLRFLQRNKQFADPRFNTAFLSIHLSLSSGTMSGKIIAGEFAGRDIASLSDDEFHTLEITLKKEDSTSYYLLKVMQQRLTGNTSTHDYPNSNTDSVSVEEARNILGLTDEFGKKDVEYAYKRLMQKLHPDRGGNDYLASRVNLARDVLLKHLDK